MKSYSDFINEAFKVGDRVSYLITGGQVVCMAVMG